MTKRKRNLAQSRLRANKTRISNERVLCETHEYPKRVAFSRGIRVATESCDFLFISGTASVDERGRSIHLGDFAAQTRRVFANITGLLRSQSADWHDIVRTTCYLVDFRYYDTFNRIRNAFYTKWKLDPLPASTCVQAGLCRPELLVEIEAIAVVRREKPA